MKWRISGYRWRSGEIEYAINGKWIAASFLRAFGKRVTS